MERLPGRPQLFPTLVETTPNISSPSSESVPVGCVREGGAGEGGERREEAAFGSSSQRDIWIISPPSSLPRWFPFFPVSGAAPAIAGEWKTSGNQLGFGGGRHGGGRRKREGKVDRRTDRQTDRQGSPRLVEERRARVSLCPLITSSEQHAWAERGQRHRGGKGEEEKGWHHPPPSLGAAGKS